MRDTNSWFTKAAGTVAICASLGLLSIVPAATRTLAVEFLKTRIDPESIAELAGLACRNFDHVVHVDISVAWPRDAVVAETSGYDRLVFWTHIDTDGLATEYLFPKGSYALLHGIYVVRGYFIVRSGGLHQGVSSIAFERADNAAVLPNTAATETKAKGSGCP